MSKGDLLSGYNGDGSVAGLEEQVAAGKEIEMEESVMMVKESHRKIAPL